MLIRGELVVVIIL